MDAFVLAIFVFSIIGNLIWIAAEVKGELNNAGVALFFASVFGVIYPICYWYYN